MELENLRALWDAHSRPVYAYLLRLTKCPEEASDHLQELFCRLAKQPEILERLEGDSRGFLMRLARNSFIDHVRRLKVRDRIFEKINAARAGEMTPAADPDQTLIRTALEAALRKLPADQRVVMVERLWKKRTLDEIAAEHGLSINTVASRYRYGLDKMREALRLLYDDIVTEQPSSKSMKKPTPKSLNETEAPIIQPLEQRRVPSATGAFLSLPILPADDHHLDDAPAHEAPTVDLPEPGDAHEIAVGEFPTFDKPTDDHAADDGALDHGFGDDVEVPITFDQAIASGGSNSLQLSETQLHDLILWSFGSPDDHSDSSTGPIGPGGFMGGQLGPFDNGYFSGSDDAHSSSDPGVGGDPGKGDIIPITIHAPGDDDGPDVVPQNFFAPIARSAGLRLAASFEDSATASEGSADHSAAPHSVAAHETIHEPTATEPASPVDLNFDLRSAPSAAPFVLLSETELHPEPAPHGEAVIVPEIHGHDEVSHAPEVQPLDPAELAHSNSPDAGHAAESPDFHWHSADLAAHDSADTTDHWVPLPEAHHESAAGDQPMVTTAPDESPAIPPAAAVVVSDLPHDPPINAAAMAVTGAIVASGAPAKSQRKQME